MTINILLLLCPTQRYQVLRLACLSLCVCLYVCPLEYHKNHTSKLHEIFCTCYLWPCPGPTLATVQYVMYFRFVDDVMISFIVYIEIADVRRSLISFARDCYLRQSEAVAVVWMIVRPGSEVCYPWLPYVNCVLAGCLYMRCLVENWFHNIVLMHKCKCYAWHACVLWWVKYLKVDSNWCPISYRRPIFIKRRLAQWN